MTQEDLIQKLKGPAPRYTSYPTVPFWNQEVREQDQWMQVVRQTFEESNQEKGISLYRHLPCCESLCTYCGCNTRITKNHTVEQGYIDLILQEWEQYLQAFPRTPIILELHRNFMGYTTCQTDLLIGLGTSSISDAKYSYLQNQKKLEDYRKGLAGNNLLILKGHFLSEEDQRIREAILEIACKGAVHMDPDLLDLLPEEAREALVQMEQEGILSLTGHQLRVTEQGKAFTRNICMVFDLRLREQNVSGERVFSKAI